MGLPLPNVMAVPDYDLRGREGWQGEWVRSVLGWLGRPHPASFWQVLLSARQILPLVPENPNKALSLVGAMKGA